MDNHDPYVILGIRNDATNEEIADAYRELLSICFGRDVSQFRRIVRAYLQLCGMGPDDGRSPPTPVHTNSFRWFRSNGFRIICFIGGSVLLGVIAYKAFQLTTKTTQSLTLTDLENSSSAIASTPTTVGQSSNGIVSTVRSISGSTFEASSKTLKWTAGAVGSAWKWSVGKVTSPTEDGQSSNEIGTTVSSIFSSTFGICSKALKWTAGSVGSAWKWSVDKVTSPTEAGQSSNEIGTTVSSISSSTFGVCSKALKWTAGSVGSAWKWSVDKVTSPIEDGQSSNGGGSTASSISNSTLGACSKALKWTEGSVGAAWQWTTGKISSQSSESTPAAAATSVGVLSKIWKWASGRN